MKRLLYFFFSQLLCLFFVSYAYAISWSEGTCDDKNRIYSGANTDYANRGAQLSWRKKNGDWVDANGRLFGSSPFATADINAGQLIEPVQVDITQIVDKWQRNSIFNHGVMIKKLKGIGNIFHSKETSDTSLTPRLELELVSGSVVTLLPNADTTLMGTHRCKGNQSELLSAGHVLLRFDLSEVKTNIKSATLNLYLKQKNRSQQQIGIFLVDMDIPSKLGSDITNIFSNFQKVYETSFENDDWQEGWSIGENSHIKIVQENHTELFEPFNGKALQVTLPKGQHYALNAHYYFENKDKDILWFSRQDTRQSIRSACFEYALRFSNSWEPDSEGKMPGFSGRYYDKEYRGGWGGRSSDGTNGWSARGLFEPVIGENNEYSGRIPVGTYLYHTDMGGKWGQHIVWNNFGLGMLEKNRWYKVKQCLKMNQAGQANGVIQAWINNQLAYYQNNINFTNNPQINIESIWMNIYYGGNKVAYQDMHVFIDELAIFLPHSKAE
ncbi:hypothetical protein N7931_07830 [Catenovulum sp. 2E275]|uniref:polysaccharide lyase n=1 Tax=Catenovulum sp. 2E275 TaxID=2980497 RepID=UPI0021D26138|nr:disaggregatase related repeat-containing protein [Catenovulum sp. 2E275]MCU4675544.1 hypothetical protein [Catenovulum sp. 2E275]